MTPLSRACMSCTYVHAVLLTTQGIGMGFRRREQALRDLSEVPDCTLSV